MFSFWGLELCGGLTCAQVDTTVPLLDLVTSVPCSRWTWPEAELYGCVRYARGKRNLQVPPAFADVDVIMRSHLNSVYMSDYE